MHTHTHKPKFTHTHTRTENTCSTSYTHTHTEGEKYSRVEVCKEAIPKFDQPLATLSDGEGGRGEGVSVVTTVHKMQTVRYNRLHRPHKMSVMQTAAGKKPSGERERERERANARTWKWVGGGGGGGKPERTV